MSSAKPFFFASLGDSASKLFDDDFFFVKKLSAKTTNSSGVEWSSEGYIQHILLFAFVSS